MANEHQSPEKTDRFRVEFMEDGVDAYEFFGKDNLFKCL